jgi:hypothetical protein
MIEIMKCVNHAALVDFDKGERAGALLTLKLAYAYALAGIAALRAREKPDPVRCPT